MAAMRYLWDLRDWYVAHWETVVAVIFWAVVATAAVLVIGGLTHLL